MSGLQDGRAARDAGMDQVQEHTPERWREGYRVIVESRFDQFPANKCFRGEDLRTAARRMGLPEPHHPNAWSANSAIFIRRWLKEGRIIVDGIDQAKGVVAHARYIRRYRKIK